MLIDLSLVEIQNLLMMNEYCKQRQYKHEKYTRETITKLKKARLEYLKQFEHPDVFETEQEIENEYPH